MMIAHMADGFVVELYIHMPIALCRRKKTPAMGYLGTCNTCQFLVLEGNNLFQNIQGEATASLPSTCPADGYVARATCTLPASFSPNQATCLPNL